MRELLEKYVSVVPNHKQIMIENMEFYAFVHFGMTTFTGKEWGDGTTPPSKFNPVNLDTDQWCEAIASAGAKGVLLTAKHHDGFCLWQTKTTEYSIKNSPYKGGKGDIVAELRKSCDKYGLKLGIYLSPWDRNSEYYGTDKYNDFYVEQLTELLTNYGDLFCMWFDGACGSYLDGKPKQKYDFKRYYDLITELQPNCSISNCGPDVRWVGNEGGLCRASEWNVVPEFALDVQTIMENSQQDTNGVIRSAVDVVAEDLGSREFLAKYNSFMWYPAEVDVSIRPGWFYHKSQDRKVKSVDKLLHIYYTSVGGNTSLLLNIPPNREGLFAQKDVDTLKELGERIKSAFAKRVVIKEINALEALNGYSAENLINGNEGTYSTAEADSYSIELKFDSVEIDKVVFGEDITHSQRIEKFEITTVINGAKKKIYEGTTVGYKKIAILEPIVCDNITITIKQNRLEPYIKHIDIYEADGKLPKPAKFDKIIKWFHDLSYKIYCNRIEKKSRNTKTNEETK